MSDPGASRLSWGIRPSFVDARGEHRQVPPDTVEAIRAVVHELAAEVAAPIVIRAGSTRRELPDGEIEWDSRSFDRTGAGIDAVDTLVAREALGRADEDSADLVYGCHTIHRPDGSTVPLIVAPSRCRPAPRSWGWMVQLYALRSQSRPGIGDLGHLRDLGRHVHQHGASFLLVNPLGASAPAVRVEASPYSPSTRRFIDPLWLDVDAAAAPSPAGSPPAESSLVESPLVDRDEHLDAKIEQLVDRWERTGRRELGSDPAAAAFVAARGEELAHYASWRGARRDGRAADRLDPADATKFWTWLAWLADEQLAAVAREIGIVTDLPVGFSAEGADADRYRGLIAEGFRIGAPPDLFSPDGQDWGLPVFAPTALAASGYRPWFETLRACLRHASGIRIDHVAGLFRQWWVPPGRSPAEGAYVLFPADDMMAVLAIESARADAFVVGEDLGTVDPATREALAAGGLLSTKVLLFEDDEPAAWPAMSMATVSTHDLPTIAGVLGGTDLDEQRLGGATVDDDEWSALVRRVAGGSVDGLGDDPIAAVHGRLARAGSDVVVAQLDDALGEPRRANMPNVADRPNWRVRHSTPFDSDDGRARIEQTAALFDRR